MEKGSRSVGEVKALVLLMSDRLSVTPQSSAVGGRLIQKEGTALVVFFYCILLLL